MTTSSRIVIGLGNVLKSDDNIGNLVVEELQKKRKRRDVIFIEAETTPENFIEKLRKLKPNVVYFIDAADFDGEVGDVRVFDIHDIEGYKIESTHNVPISLFRESLPESEIKVVAIKVKSMDFGDELSEELKEKFDDVVRKVEKFI